MKRALKTLFIIIVIELIFCSIWRVTHTDINSPGDESFKIKFENIPNEKNSIHYFIRAREEIVLDEKLNESMRLSEIAEGKKWDPDFAHKVINQNKKAFELLEDGLSQPYSQIINTNTYDMNLPIGKDLSRLLTLRAIQYHKSGCYEKSFDELIKIIEYGHLVEKVKGGSIIEMLVGRYIKTNSLDVIQRLLVDSDIPSKALSKYIKNIENYNPDIDIYINSIKGEYTYISKLIDALAKGEELKEGDFAEFGFHKGFKSSYKSGYLFHP
ncbi:MAG: hypothetical protein U9N53_14030, partial [Bacteroidota bacterium]|nr:hypothetical protein [Bacteroidota bacterium]